MRRDYHKADCLFRMVWGSAFIVLGLLYIPWLALLGLLILGSLVFSCTRLAYRSGPASRNTPTHEVR